MFTALAPWELYKHQFPWSSYFLASRKVYLSLQNIRTWNSSFYTHSNQQICNSRTFSFWLLPPLSLGKPASSLRSRLRPAAQSPVQPLLHPQPHLPRAPVHPRSPLRPRRWPHHSLLRLPPAHPRSLAPARLLRLLPHLSPHRSHLASHLSALPSPARLAL